MALEAVLPEAERGNRRGFRFSQNAYFNENWINRGVPTTEVI
jgi:hypothetical protein